MVYVESGPQTAQAPTQTATVVSKGSLSTVLDTDPVAANESGIVIGGPCVNTLSSELLGEACGKLNLQPGEARVTFVQKDSKSWVVIAGYADTDTLFAAKLLAEKPSVLTGGSDLVVSGTFDAPKVRPYVPLGNTTAAAVAPTPQEQQPTQIPAPTASGETAAVPVATCEAPSEATGTYQFQIKKFGMTKDVTSYPKVAMDGLDGTVSFATSEKFQAQYGVNWLQYVVHVLKGGCNGPEVAALTFRWTDGDGDKSQSFTVPEQGCYCLKVANQDLSIDNADIQMLGDGVFTLPFSTVAPPGGNMVTGNAFFFALSKQDLNDMNVWK